MCVDTEVRYVPIERWNMVSSMNMVIVEMNQSCFSKISIFCTLALKYNYELDKYIRMILRKQVKTISVDYHKCARELFDRAVCIKAH